MKKLMILLVISAFFGLSACDDGDKKSNNTNNADCGNGVIDTGEDCDQTALGGADCTTIPGGFTGGTLACAADCTFDTAQCEGGDLCGNGALDDGEDCDGTELGGADCTTVAGGFIGGTLACATDCTFDTAQCEVDPCGNGVIEGDEDCDGAELGGADCTTIGGGFTSGTLACASDCTFDTAQCSDLSPASLLILAARQAADGTGLNLELDDVVVTYVRPGFGSDLPGFFVQAEQEGPALFIGVDPATITPTPEVGDTVHFFIEAMATAGSLRYAAAINTLSVTAQGFDTTTLLQQVDAETDLVSALDDYESELVAAQVTLTSDFSGAGAGHQAAQVATTGVPSNSNLRLRIPTTLLNGWDLESGCVVTLNGSPMWRYDATAQFSVWSIEDLEVVSCPNLRVVSATAASATSVVVTFSRGLNGSTLLADGSQFTIAGLTISGAVLSAPDQVTLTTSAQTGGIPYEVVVAGGLQDIYAGTIDPAADSAGFLGFANPAVVMINEFNVNITSGCDLIELRVVSGGSMDGFSLRWRTDTLLTFTGLNVATNDFILVHINSGSGTCNPASATNEVTGPAEHPQSTVITNVDTAYDWYSPYSGLAATDGTIALYDNLGGLVDAVLYTDDVTGTAAAGSETLANEVAAAGGWTNPDGTVPAAPGYIDDVFCANAVLDSNATGTSPTGVSIQRTSNVDNNHMGDWAMVTATWGALNAGQTAF